MKSLADPESAVRDFAISQRNRELLNPKLVASLKVCTRVLVRPIGLIKVSAG